MDENKGHEPTQPPANCNSVSAKFTTDINPIIQNSCAFSSGCHGNGSTNGPGAPTNFDQIRIAAASIKNAVQSGRMPKGGSLSVAQIQSIACWVNNGAENN